MLESHAKKKEIDQWDVGYALISGTLQFFGATELNYLERFFYDEAVKIVKYQLLNVYKPHSSNIGMATQLTFQNYTDHAFFLLENVVDCDVYSKKKSTVNTNGGTQKGLLQSSGLILYVNSKKNDAHAVGILSDENKLVIRKGSVLSKNSNLLKQKGQAGLEKLRQKLIDDGIVVDRAFTVDYEFNSPSTVASVILGTSSSGNEKWKDMNGTALGELKK